MTTPVLCNGALLHNPQLPPPAISGTYMVDGKANGGDEIAQEDTYVWVIKCVDPQNKKHRYVGHVSIIK